jgi:chromosome segregation ATPase
MWSSFARGGGGGATQFPIPNRRSEEEEEEEPEEEEYGEGDDGAWGDDDDIGLDDIDVHDEDDDECEGAMIEGEDGVAAPASESAAESESARGGRRRVGGEGDGDDDADDDDDDGGGGGASDPPIVPSPSSNVPNVPKNGFGAALLAFVDDDENENENENDDGGHGGGGGGYGIGTGTGGGYVLGRLSRFIIEAATAPREDRRRAGRGGGERDEDTDAYADVDEDRCDDVVDDADDDGWDDDDDVALDSNDDDDDGVEEEEDDDDDEVKTDDDRGDVVDDEPSPTCGLSSEDIALPEPTICVGGRGRGHEQHQYKDDGMMMPTTSETTSNEGEGDGWEDDDDDIDVSFDSAHQRNPGDAVAVASIPNVEGIPRHDHTVSDHDRSDGIPDSIRDFVATTESVLDMEFTDNAWKTPPRSMNGGASRRREDVVSPEDEFPIDPHELAAESPMKVKGTNLVARINATYAHCAEETDGSALSKCLTDFVNDLDAELNDFARDSVDASTGKTSVVNGPDAIVPEKIDGPPYNYDESKDDSPEPPPSQPSVIPGVSIERLPIPHQESWYLNAMEGGKGGVVYGEERALESKSTWRVTIPKGQIMTDIDRTIPDTSLPISDFIAHSKVGMPLSELPSSADSLPGSNPASEYGYNAQADGPIEQSELHCKFLELILPLSNDDEKKMEEHESGTGLKKLPDGTTVLVNYEQLLLNEATKRILLQRSVHAYENTVQMLQKKYHATTETVLEQENKLSSADNEISQLKELVFRLQDEKDNMINERHLFEAELAAAVNDKEYLEREVETIQEDLKAKEEWCARNIERQKNFEQSLQQSNMERSRLIDQVESLQSDTLEMQKELDQMNGTVKSLMSATATESRTPTIAESSTQENINYEIDRLNNQISNLLAIQASSSAQLEEHDILREKHERLTRDFSETHRSLSKLRDENESLRSNQREYESRIDDMKATVESLDCDSGEIDKLAAEIASLTYELGAKSTECEESVAALQTLQCKLDSAELRLQDSKNMSEIDQSLRAEHLVLTKQLLDSHSTTRSLENQNFDFSNRLEESSRTIEELVSKIQSLNDHQIESAALEEELSRVRKSLDEKSSELAESLLLITSLQTNLNVTEAELAAYHAVAKENVQDNEIEQSNNCALCIQLEDVRGMCSILQGQKSALEKSLAIRSSAVNDFEMQIKSLNAKVLESSHLRSELSRVKKSLDEKIHENETLASSCEHLKLELLNTQSNHEILVAKNEVNTNLSLEQVSRLQSQIADLLKDHNATMINIEEQLTSTLRLNSDLHTQCDEYRMRLDEAERKYAYLSQSTSDSIAKYSDHISNLKGENLNLSSALNSRQLKASQDEAKFEQLQRSIDATKKEIDSMTILHQELIDENDRLRQEKAAMKQSLDSNARAAEKQMLLIETECSKLQANLDSSCEARVTATKKVSTLIEQQEALAIRNTELEEKLFDASFVPSETERLVDENASLTNERDQLKEETLALKEQIKDLISRVEFLSVADIASSNESFTSVEKESLLARIRTLEEELKTENLDELRDELSTLHEERQQLDLDNEELLVQLGLMQQVKIETQAECEIELDTLREQVINLQDECTRLQNNLDMSMTNTLSLRDEDKSHSVKMLKDENNSLRHTLHQVREENKSLTGRIKDLEEMKALEIANNGVADDEIKKLHQELALLELKLVNKEEEFKSAENEKNASLENRDLEIKKLTTKCFLKEEEIKEVSSKLDATNDEMASFTRKLESIQSDFQRQRQGDQSVHDFREEKSYEADDDEISLQDILADATLDSDDYLRSQIVVLAKALQRSELQRADALERIFLERKANADALCQLGESAKRFYSTVR